MRTPCWLAAIGACALAATPSNAADPAPLAGFTAAQAGTQRLAESRFLELPTPEAFRDHLTRITRDPHPAGSAANRGVADYLAQVMEQAGWDVKRHEYEVYRPKPRPEASVALVTPIRLPLNNQEYILDEDRFSSHADLEPAWNAYSGSGDVTGEVVYVNYGTREDFAQLAELGVSLEGRVAIARYGGNYRGYKAKYAEEAGAIGLVIYSDPANGGYPSGPVYPEGKSWSESTVQRGSLKALEYPGDPLTPFVPSLPGGRGGGRLDPADVPLPTIPVTPLPYGSATQILSRMEGDAVPHGWQGGLPFTYRLTGGPGLTVRVRVQQPKAVLPITDVVGILKGSQFPDEWVILGSHYDAWTFGAADPNGGTAMLLTLAEALGQLARDGYRPRRSIVIGHWDAEELGIIGSVEYVEQFRQELSRKGVAYVNADMVVTGGNPGAAASPTLKSLLIAAAGAVPYPGTDGTVLDRWNPADSGREEPGIGNLGGGSDHLGFYMYVGIPTAEMSLGGPSLYHSGYDDFAFFERFCDPDFVYGPTVARVDGVVALRLANADLIPYDVTRYGPDLAAHTKDLAKLAQEAGLAVDLEPLQAAIERLQTTADAYDAARERFLGGEPSRRAVAGVNASLLSLERAFIHDDGLQEQAWSRSLYAAADPFSGYAAWMLPGLRYEVDAGNADGVARWVPIYAAAVDELDARLGTVVEKLQVR